MKQLQKNPPNSKTFVYTASPAETLLHMAAIIDNSNDAILSKTLQGRITSWNKGAERLYGYKAAEALGKSVAMLFPKDRKDEMKKILSKVSSGQKVEHYETIRVRKDGRSINISATISPVKDHNGNIVGASTISRNITESKKIEQNIKFLYDVGKQLSSSMELETIFDNVVNLAVPQIAEWCSLHLVEKNGEVRQVAIGHVDPKKIVWAWRLNKKHPPNPKQKDGVMGVIRTGKSELAAEFPLEKMIMQFPDPEMKKLLKQLDIRSYMIVPIKIGGKVSGAISFISNSSGRAYESDDLQLAEEMADRVGNAIEKAQLYREAKEAISLRDEFISMASHELKTPLTSLRVFNSIIEKKLQDYKDSEALGYIKRVDKQIDRLNSLVYELLDISKIQNGLLELQKEPLNLEVLIRENIEVMQRIFEHHKIEADFSIRSQVIGDKDRLSQAVVNLIENAVKYSPGKDKVIVKGMEEEGKIVVSVKDYGIGLHQEDKDRIFERFFQSSDPDRKTFPGLGLGLYITREVIARHGGKIWVKSQNGRGSTFFFSLPKKSTKMTKVES